MLADIVSAVRLQEVDIRLTDLAKEVASLPKHIAEIEKKLARKRLHPVVPELDLNAPAL